MSFILAAIISILPKSERGTEGSSSEMFEPDVCLGSIYVKNVGKNSYLVIFTYNISCCNISTVEYEHKVDA